MGIYFAMRVVGGRVPREGDGGGVDFPLEGGGGDACWSRWSLWESAIGLKGMRALKFSELSRGSSWLVVLGLLLWVLCNSCHAVSLSATGERVEHVHGRTPAPLPTQHPQVMGGELNVPTPDSGGVALSFPLPKEGRRSRLEKK